MLKLTATESFLNYSPEVFVGLWILMADHLSFCSATDAPSGATDNASHDGGRDFHTTYVSLRYEERTSLLPAKDVLSLLLCSKDEQGCDNWKSAQYNLFQHELRSGMDPCQCSANA